MRVTFVFFSARTQFKMVCLAFAVTACVRSFRHLIFVGSENRDWEYQSGPQDSDTVAGKIHLKGEFWTSRMHASKFVTAVKTNGYSLPFVTTCPAFYAKNNASSLRNYNFVTDAIEEKCIIQTSTIPYCWNPLTVSESPKFRPGLDLRT